MQWGMMESAFISLKKIANQKVYAQYLLLSLEDCPV